MRNTGTTVYEEESGSPQLDEIILSLNVQFMKVNQQTIHQY